LQIARYVEELSAERLSREVMDERKTKEIKAVESSISLVRLTLHVIQGSGLEAGYF